MPNNLTVRDLIAALSKLPPNMPLRALSDAGDTCEVTLADSYNFSLYLIERGGITYLYNIGDGYVRDAVPLDFAPEPDVPEAITLLDITERWHSKVLKFDDDHLELDLVGEYTGQRVRLPILEFPKAGQIFQVGKFSYVYGEDSVLRHRHGKLGKEFTIDFVYDPNKRNPEIDDVLTSKDG